MDGNVTPEPQRGPNQVTVNAKWLADLQRENEALRELLEDWQHCEKTWNGDGLDNAKRRRDVILQRAKEGGVMSDVNHQMTTEPVSISYKLRAAANHIDRLEADVSRQMEIANTATQEAEELLEALEAIAHLPETDAALDGSEWYEEAQILAVRAIAKAKAKGE